MCHKQENYPEDRKDIAHGQLLIGDAKFSWILKKGMKTNDSKTLL